MSDDGPTITVTRGTKDRSRRRRSRSSRAASSASSGWGLPGPGDVVSGLIRGTRAAWWAGLGLLDVAQSAGAQVFDALVEEGKSWEQAQRERREQRARQVRRTTRESDAIQAAEERVQEEVNAALQRIGVPSRDDVDALKDQIEALNDRVDRLTDAVRHTDA